ncbi:MAG: Trk system potassium transporter TrkA [Candidatus Poseidoniales archaeon]
MRVLIAGAGEVGFRVGRDLVYRGHEVTLVDSNPSSVKRAQTLDVQVFKGNAASAKFLMEEASIKEADLFIGVTGKDVVNLVGCSIAKKMGCSTIARLNNPDIIALPSDYDHKQLFGVDAFVSPDELSMHRIWQILSRPALTRLEHFSVGSLRILEIRLNDSSPSVGRPLSNIKLPPHCRIALIAREEGVTIPSEQDILMPRDRILILLSENSELEELSDSLGIPKEITSERNIKRLMIAGTSRIALNLAKQVHEDPKYEDIEVYVTEPDPIMAEKASSDLPEGVRVLVGSSTDRHFLREEGIRYEDLFVAATDREDWNVLSCLLAKKEGAKRTVALVYQTELEYVIQDTGIDTLINPKRVTVNAIVNRATSTDKIEGMEELEGGEASVREFLIKKNSKKIGLPIEKLGVPDKTLIAMVNRNGEAIFPDEEFIFNEGDHVLVFTLKGKLPEVEKFFY